MEYTLPWYIAGPILGLMVPLLLVLAEKQLGVSSSFRVLGSFVLPKLSYFKYQKEKDYWQMKFVLGLILAAIYFSCLDLIPALDVEPVEGYAAHANSIYSVQNWGLFLFGGAFVGFGARYAGGCTAGHCIMGGSQLAKSSIITTISFFIGGLITTHFILPQILNL